MAWAEDKAVGQTEAPPSSDQPLPEGSPGESPPELGPQPGDSTSAAEPPPPPESSAPANPPVEQQPGSQSGSGQTVDGAPRSEGSRPASGPSTGGDARSDANAEHGLGSAPSSIVNLDALENEQPTSDVVVASPSGPSGPAKLPPAAVTTPAGGDIFRIIGLETGGMKLLVSSVDCGQIVCTGPTSGPFVHGVLVSRLQAHTAAAAEREVKALKASELPLSSILGAPGPARGPFSSLGGGSGGAAVAFTLISLIAVLALRLVRADWTTVLIPTATWRPSAYVPPIESPG